MMMICNDNDDDDNDDNDDDDDGTFDNLYQVYLNLDIYYQVYNNNHMI